MNDLDALKVTVRDRAKTWAGLPSRRRVEDSWTLSPEAFWSFQAASFERMYGFARARVPYYRDQPGVYPPSAPRAAGVLERLARLPVLPKAVVRARNPDFRASPPLPLTTLHRTSGTSGTPLVLAATLGERALWNTIRNSWYRRLLGTRTPRRLLLGGFFVPASADELCLVDPLTRDVHLSIYSLLPRNRDRVAAILERFRPRLIVGYASAAHLLAKLVGDRVSGTRGERVAVVTSEVLQPHWRPEIEGGLCRRVCDMYSSQEGVHACFECAHGRLHVNPLVGIVEILDHEGRPAPAGERGRVVVTGLMRRSMPLIRYDLGDTAVSTGYATDCPCGLGWPTIGAVEGRSEDLVLTADGRRIGYLAFHATKNVDGLLECQLVQTAVGRFVCNLVAEPGFDRAGGEASIQREIERRVGEAVEVEYRYLEMIPRGPNGKFKAVVVDLDAGGPARAALPLVTADGEA
jgi:phenylacetate-CoA ligase